MKKPRSIKRNSWVFKLPIFLLILIMGCAPVAHVETTRELWTPSPEDLYGELFFAVQADTSLFPDSKTFVDARPLVEPDSILLRYSRLTLNSTTSLRIFLNEHFEIPSEEVAYQSDSSAIENHISNLWEVLKRPADDKTPGTLLPLPNPYIVPGGRFREIYYWDSYFTMLGLEEDGEKEIIKNMVDNFSYLIDTYGFIPNGNRSYYLSRSQPPFYSKMVELLAGIEGEHIFVEYLPFLEKEYAFWMRGAN
ncbi:MAG TPA: trehalase family glycosidase, partial [Gillisia sp.]|nr:trehalase family glycosidase [Gillisia sp.]